MSIITKKLLIKSNGENDMIDITDKVSNLTRESNLEKGVVTVFVVGSTAAITTIEYEPGLKYDFSDMLSKIAPKDNFYKHNDTWHDGNGHSHLRASLVGPSITIPFTERRLTLGTWQQIVLLEMDTRPREREIILQIIGDM